MKDRLTTAAGAFAALLILYVLFFQSTETPPTRPVTIETGRNGYAAVSTWLSRAGVPVVSLRERFDTLLDPLQPAGRPFRGNILITTLPHLIPVRAKEHASLKAWLRSGNTLLVFAALDDTPEWTPGNASAHFLRDLQIMTGLRFLPLREGADGADRPRTGGETTLDLAPVRRHPLMRDVTLLRGFSDEASALWRPAFETLRAPLLLRLAVETESGTDAAWQRRYGNGDIIVVASGTLLTNHLVGASGAGAFLANLVHHHLGDGGEVIFDDMHQGLSVIYDAAAFYRDPRLHYSVVFLIGAWLVYLLGSSNRLVPPSAPLDVPRQRDFLEAVGGFMARRLPAQEAGMLLLETWFDEVRRARGLPAGTPLWEALAATPALDGETLRGIRRLHERLARGRRVDLVRLHNLLTRAREAIG